MKTTRYFVLIFALVIMFAAFAHAQTVTPFMSLGNAQFFDNNGKPLATGVLYSYLAGTTTQQATYTDSTGLFQNPNPIPFGSGARVGIWLTSIATYKFVLCLQNDGASCAPADVLFSVDNVPGCPGCALGGNTFTGTFVSGTPSPATTGILRLASSDSICWRSAAGTTNLCISKDPSDVLNWSGGVIKLAEINCVISTVGFDYLCPDSTLHRLSMFNNGGVKMQIVGSGVDINNSDQVIQLHFGTTAAPLSAGALTPGQPLIWNGTNLGTGALSIVLPNEGATGTTINTLTKFTGAPSTAIITTTTDVDEVAGITCGGAGITGSATICYSGTVPCLFDGSTTANHYVTNSALTPGNCHDAGAARVQGVIGQVTSTNSGVGLYTVNLSLPPQPPPGILLRSTTTTIVNSSFTNSNTTIFSKAVTMPAHGCPCRVEASYSLFLTTGASGVDAAMVSDGTHQFAVAVTNTTGSVGSVGFGMNGAESSPTTYANSAVVTFTVVAAGTHAGGTTVSGSVGAGLTSAPSSGLSLTVFSSN